jgi:hypothetical protein
MGGMIGSVYVHEEMMVYNVLCEQCRGLGMAMEIV